MTQPVPPEGALCGGHSDSVATSLCPRCGAFMCPRCENRVRPESVPMCPACWTLRASKVQSVPATGIAPATLGLIAGVVALIPLCPIIQVVALVLNIIVWVHNRRAPPPTGRWKPLLGMGLAVLGMGITALLRYR
ncbi:hypothetical protein DRW03_10885 [Corallococcus sp. H22C18031201]|uniref:hypothetical protein n=1 Tax=Citreicoccus inhibens TaxID=2849499 RepID=UPI000E75C3AA|nr:hypothetical protein [Citreicoccus inhibens]MBU8898729.1 hypothetical protein [Citreicoccus inhibens]RJS24103.1 hypothetical protein DRW03_10885 [Corallococcus sp. H22C18031201]